MRNRCYTRRGENDFKNITSRVRRSRTYTVNMRAVPYAVIMCSPHRHTQEQGPLLGLAPSLGLGYVRVLVCGVLGSLKVLLVDQGLYTLLDHADAGRETSTGLTNDLLYEEVVLEDLARLHDAYDGCL